MSEKLTQAAQYVMEQFNFNRVHTVMTALSWEWATEGGVPSVDRIELEAERLLRACIHEWEVQGRPASGMTYAIGGLEARIDCWPNSEPELSLLFYVDKARSTGEY